MVTYVEHLSVIHGNSLGPCPRGPHVHGGGPSLMGAIIGGVVAGPLGAVIGAVALAGAPVVHGGSTSSPPKPHWQNGEWIVPGGSTK